jgi:hypothetical protein
VSLHAFAAAVAVGLLLAVPRAAAPHHQVDFRSTFDDGTIAPWHEVQRELDRPTADSFRIVDSPRRSGAHAAMFVARQGYSDFGYDEGADLCCGPTPRESEGSDFWYAWSTLFAAPWQAPYRWGIFAQWHSDFGIPPPLDFNVGADAIWVQLHTGDVTLADGGSWSFDHSYRIVQGVAVGRWHDFVLHVRWSATNGAVAVWHRLAGQPRLQKVLDLRRVPTLQRLGTTVSPVYTLLGIYRASYCGKPTELDCTSPLGVQPDTVVYHDEFRRSPTVFDWCLACRK